MKNSIFIFALSVMGLNVYAQNPFSCPPLTGKYSVSVEPWQGRVAGPYGSVKIGSPETHGMSATCKYPLDSKVKVYAEPLKTGQQILSVNKTQGDLGYAFQILNTDFTVVSEGTLAIGAFKQITLSIALTGCGGEGGSSICGEDVILSKSK